MNTKCSLVSKNTTEEYVFTHEYDEITTVSWFKVVNGKAVENTDSVYNDITLPAIRHYHSTPADNIQGWFNTLNKLSFSK